jgi:uncharacterized protein
VAFRRFQHKTVTVYYDDGIESAELFVTGFKGFGAVGYITTLHLVEKLGCKRSGFIVTKYMPEEATLDKNGDIVAAFTLYGCSVGDKRMAVLVNHDIPMPQERMRFAHAVIRFLQHTGIKEAVLVGGFDSRFRRGEEELRWLHTSTYGRRLEAPLMDQGLYVVGPLALLLVAAEARGYPAAAILPYAEASRPDPRAAAVAVRTIGSLYGIEVGVEDLLEEARKIEEMIIELEKQQREAMAPASSERVYM